MQFLYNVSENETRKKNAYKKFHVALILFYF